MKIRTLAVLSVSVSLALLISGCVINGSSSLTDIAHEPVFRTQGRILAGDRLKPASNLEVALYDHTIRRFSPMGPIGSKPFKGAVAKTNSEGRFAIETNRSARLEKALKKGFLGLVVTGHEEGTGIFTLKMEANPDYVIRKKNYPSDRSVNGRRIRK